jgi:asparagine synthase (glutamine-hydrolysing)
MCGIAGYMSQTVSAVPEKAKQTLCEAILYRGRDARADWGDDRHVHLFHTRLSIIDLKTGGQPMHDASGRFVIVFNGEIYNYRELRDAYRKAGANFRTESDTEVILEGYRLKGARVCEDLNGMFAFAIWDTLEKQLFLARDRLGKKPLFWTRLAGVFCFASTLDTFREMRGWQSILSSSAILFCGLTGTFAKGGTIYHQAHALPPACHAVVQLDGDLQPKIETYWRMALREKSRRKLPELLEEYEALLSDAINIRLRSDVPVALTFSGGVDSGTIACIATRKLGRQLACYTVDYHTEEDRSEETLIAKAVAEQLGLSWHYVHFDYHRQLLNELTDAYRFYDQPCQQIALTYSSRLYEAVKPFATVVLSGNGADELFTGYVGDEKLRLKGWGIEAARWLRPLVRDSQVSPYLRMSLPEAHAESLIASAKSAGAGEQVLAEFASGAHAMAAEALECGAESALDLKMFMSLRYSGADSNFRIPDISGMAAQVEVRSPFLDYRMVEFAARLPHRYKVGNVFSAKKNKFLPKCYYERHVAADIAWSRKKGMGWNLRWDRSIANDPTFATAFGRAWESLDHIGMDTRQFRVAMSDYVEDVRRSIEFSSHARLMMNGLMLGLWLSQHPEARLAA